MDKAQLLGEIEDVIRTMPPVNTLDHDSADVLEWLGRASAVIHELSLPMAVEFDQAARALERLDRSSSAGKRDIQRLLSRARHGLRLETVGPLSVALPTGAVFDYFDEVRKIIETAAVDILFVDPFLNAEFVSRYLPHVKAGVTIRLLTRRGIEQLLPAAEAFAGQHEHSLSIRASANMHDRFVIVDGSTGYQSGGSFADGAKRAPITFMQVTDAFAEVRRQYEERWAAGTVHR